MEQNINAQNAMNEQNVMNTENTQTAAPKAERLTPTAEIIERNDFLTAKINELFEAEDPAIDVINEYAAEQSDLHAKYSFFDQIFEENGLKGIKDVKGNIRIPAIYTDFYELYDYQDSYAPELKDIPICAYDQHDKCALVLPDGKGTPLTPFIYDAIAKEATTNEFIIVQSDKKGIMDRKGNVLIPCQFDTVYEYFNSIRALEAGGKFGLMTDWELYVAPVYDEVSEKDDYVYVRLGDTWGYIDYDGNFIDEADQETLDESDLLNYEPNI